LRSIRAILWSTALLWAVLSKLIWVVLLPIHAILRPTSVLTKLLTVLLRTVRSATSWPKGRLLSVSWWCHRLRLCWWSDDH
jgi:hypothetical protein